MDGLSNATVKRTKHAALARPDVGEFGRHELAILGAPCGDIQALVARLLPYLVPALRVAEGARLVEVVHRGAEDVMPHRA